MSGKNINDELLARYLEGKANEEETREVLAYLAENEDELDVMTLAGAATAFLDSQEVAEKEDISVYKKSMFPVMAARTQNNEKSCAIQAQQIILKDYGINVSQDELTDIARKNGWFIDSMGSPMDFVGELLNYYKVAAVQMRNANIYHLMHELSQGHRIIVGLDSDNLKDKSHLQQFEEVLNGKEADHVLVVAGIDTSDPNNLKVTLTDPTDNELQRVYPAEQFMKSWEESGCFMVATTQPAPLEYNKVSMQNFDYQQGYVEKFADIAYSEIIKRLENEGYIRGNRWNRIIRYLVFCVFLPILILATFFLAWRFYTPIDMKISLHENENFKIPSQPFTKGTLNVSYSDIEPVTFRITSDNMTASVNEINYKFKNKDARIVFSSNGFIPLDTIVKINKIINLEIRRDNSLAKVFGFVQDENGKPVSGATLTLQDIVTQSDANGMFEFEIPPYKQKPEQSLSVEKSGYQRWIHHSGVPSQTEAWIVVLKNIK